MSSIERIATLHDPASNRAYDVFQFDVPGGLTRQLRVDRGQAYDPKFVCRALLRAGADLPLNPAEAHHLVRSALSSQCSIQLQYADSLGWQPKSTGFMFHDEFFQTSAKRCNTLPPAWADSERVTPLQAAGKLKLWKALVAGPVAASSRLMMLAAATFAAPLVRFTDGPNPGLNLFGLRQGERTIAAALVGSILGQVAGDAVCEWATEPTRLLSCARHFNDMVFLTGSSAISAPQMATRQHRERLVRLRVGDARPDKAVIAAAIGAQPSWRGIFVTLLPHSHGTAIPDGSALDMFDAPVCWDIPPASDPSALLDAPLSHSDTAAILVTAQALFGISGAAHHHHGVPIRAYIRFLVKRQGQLPAMIKRLQATFRGALRARGLKQIPASLLDTFGLMYAGARFAIDAGVLPWEDIQLQTALQTCLVATMKHHRAGEFTPKKIRAILRKRLAEPYVVQRTANQSFGPDQHDGFFDVIGGRRRYTVHASAFRSWFHGSAQCARALCWMHEQELLVMSGRPIAPCLMTTEWAERTPRWPDGRIQKSIVFFGAAEIKEQHWPNVARH
jgi:putative DNA primase/helicase